MDSFSRNSTSGSVSDNRPAAQPCVSGCGFFGSSSTEGFCSKCFKEHQSKQQQGHPQTNNNANTDSTTSSSNSTASASISIPVLVHSSRKDSPSTSISVTIVSSSSNQSSRDSVSTSIPITVVSSPTTQVASQLSAVSLSNQPTTLDLDDQRSNTTTSATDDATRVIPIAVVNTTDQPVKKKNRCTTCSKLVRLDYFTCQCDVAAMFCAAHRLPHQHQCTFNHREKQANQIKQNNPIVKDESFERI